MSEPIAFTVMGEPASKSRARFTGRGSSVRAYTPERTRDGERAVAAAYLTAAKRLNATDETTAFHVHADFYLGKMQRRDIDNMLKLVLDGLNKIAWADDVQVVKLTGQKMFHAEEPRTEVMVTPVGTLTRPYGACARCGGKFAKPPSFADKIYCSGVCRSAALAEARERDCAHCGKRFLAQQKARFCSVDCKVRSTRIDCVCVTCGAVFTKPRSLNRSGNNYCSPECKATYWRDHRRSAAKGVCQDCGGPTTKKTYLRCRDCSYAAGGRHAYKTPQEES